MNTQTRLLLGWLTIILFCVAILIYHSINNGIKFDTDILNMLDLGDNSSDITKAARKPFENKALLLFQLDDSDASKTYLKQLKSNLSKQTGIQEVNFNFSDKFDFKQIIATYNQYPLAMLSDDALIARDNNDYQYIINRYVQLLSQPSNPLVSLSISKAPLLNIADWFGNRVAQPLWKQDQGFLYIEQQGLRYYPLFIEFDPKAIQLDLVVNTIDGIDKLLTQANSTTPSHIFKSGLAFHSAAVTKQAQFEMQFFSAVSLIGVLLLTFLSFRNLRPLVCIAVLIAASMLAGMTALVLVFEQIHLLSLVFAISLIGIAVDYGYHIMFAAKYTGLRGISLSKHIAPALLMGAGTTLISYLLLLFLPILLLKQVAVFVGAGIFFAVFTGLSVITWWSVKRSPEQAKIAMPIASPKGFKILLVLLSICAVIAIPQWHFEDDINMFNSSPQHLLNGELKVSQLVGNQQYPRFISVSGNNKEQILQRFEQTRQAMQTTTANKFELKGLDLWVPSQATQKANAQWLKEGLTQQKLLPIANMIEPIALDNLLAPSNQWLSDEDLPSLIREMYPDFIHHEGKLVGILSYMGPLDTSLMSDIQSNLDFQINYYDQPSQYSAALTKLRHYILYFLAMAMVALVVIMLTRYSIKTGIKLAALPIVVAFSALAITQIISGSVTIFNLLGCILILALSVDYVFFLKEHGRVSYVLKSIFLSATTTSIAFGIMVFSQTPAIWQFGLTILIGVTLGLMLCLLLPSSLLVKGSD